MLRSSNIKHKHVSVNGRWGYSMTVIVILTSLPVDRADNLKEEVSILSTVWSWGGGFGGLTVPGVAADCSIR